MKKAEYHDHNENEVSEIETIHFVPLTAHLCATKIVQSSLNEWCSAV